MNRLLQPLAASSLDRPARPKFTWKSGPYRRLVILMVLVALPAAGCCRSWPRLSWYRGDACSAGTAYSSYVPFETGPIYEGMTLPASPGYPLELPGPMEAIQ